MVAIVFGLTLGLGLVYVRYLLLPIAREAASLSAQRQRSLHLSQQIDQGTVQVGSRDYWTAIEAIATEEGRSVLE